MTDPLGPETAAAAEDKETFEAMEQLPRQLQEIWEHLGSYLGAKWAQSRGDLRNGLLAFALWALLILLFSGVFLIAIAFVFYGSALALAQLLGGRPWAGFLVSGGVLLAVGALYIRWKLSSLRRAALEKKIKDYEQKLERQKEKYGVNALERAATAD
ncbi:MAG: phage holin family protein [Deltaproteobacteria bacterium]|nr:phage holin family protein [Deltaproteobacteria bacterium]